MNTYQRGYQCGICMTEWETWEEKEVCEARVVEEKVFEPGDKVRLEHLHRCQTPLLGLERIPMIGMVIDVVGPLLPDEEYENQVIKDPRRLKQHIYWYMVEYDCGRCQQSLKRQCCLPDLHPYHLH